MEIDRIRILASHRLKHVCQLLTQPGPGFPANVDGNEESGGFNWVVKIKSGARDFPEEVDKRKHV